MLHWSCVIAINKSFCLVGIGYNNGKFLRFFYYENKFRIKEAPFQNNLLINYLLFCQKKVPVKNILPGV